MGDAVEMAFEAATAENCFLKDAALTLLQLIQDTYNNSADMPWPPSASYFD